MSPCRHERTNVEHKQLHVTVQPASQRSFARSLSFRRFFFDLQETKTKRKIYLKKRILSFYSCRVSFDDENVVYNREGGGGRLRHWGQYMSMARDLPTAD